MPRPIVIEILAKASGARREMDATASSASGLGSKMKTAAAVGAGAVLVAGAAAVKFGVDSVDAASKSQQSIGATSTVFGKYAKDVVARSKEAATAVGLSANEYRELANVTGASLKGTGLPLEQVSNLTDNLNKRAADLAATFGGKTSDAVSAFGSLLRGEADPIERYGISVKQSDVNARLAANGQDKLTGAALKQAEMMARLDLAFMQSQSSAGAFARESDTLANRQQILGAKFEDIKAKVGSALLPILTTLATMLLTNVIPAVEQMATKIGSFGQEIVGKLGPALSGAGGFFSQFAAVAAVMGTTLTTTIIPAVASVASYFATRFGPVLAQVGSVITGKVLPAVASMAQFFYGQVIPAVVQVATNVGARLKPVLDQVAQTIASKVVPTVVLIIARFREWQPTIEKVTLVVVKVIGKVLEFAAAILGKVLPPVIKFAGFLISNLVPAVLDGVEILARIIGKVIEFGAKIVGAVQKVAEFVTGLKNKFEEAVTFVNGIPGKIVTALGDLGSKLTSAGQALIQGLIDGITSKLADVKAKMAEVANAVKGFLPGSPVKEGPLTSWNNGGAGKRLMDELVYGIGARQSAVRTAMARVSDTLAKTLDGSAVGARFAGDVASALGSPRLSASGAFAASVSSTTRDRAFSIVLSAEQLDAIERGRRVTADVKAFVGAGGIA